MYIMNMNELRIHDLVGHHYMYLVDNGKANLSEY